MAIEPPPDVVRVLAPLVQHPDRSAVITDFDGTLAPIVSDPATARPVDGAIEVLARLAKRFAVVAVISGRPASFLVDRMASAPGASPPDGLSSVRLVGLYGLEQAGGGGAVTVEPGAERWRAVVGEAVERLRAVAPPGVEVEPKGLATTVHWRRAPEAADRMLAVVEAEASHTGLRSHRGRMSIELRPPTDTDKGSVVRALATGCAAAGYFGDDLADLPAFAALSDLARTGGLATASIAAVDDESAAEVAGAADVAVAGPSGVLGALRWLADAGPATGTPEGTGRS